MTSPTTFGALLRQLRKRAGMTQSDLAAAVGYSVSFVCNLEQNRRVPAVAVVLQHFVPALGLQEEVGFVTQLIALAAQARGEHLPSTLTVQHATQLSITETFTLQPNHLPAPPTNLIGREQAIKVLCNRLQGHSGRLLTLVGPPGVGKTRLGLAVATRLQALYKDGAHLITLAAVTDPEHVAVTIANQLELTDTGQQSPQARLIQGLRHKEILLVLDNFEQIIVAAGLLAALLAACPGLHLLVTSRERLHLRAEQRFPVPPLDLEFAVALFVQQAQAVDPAFELTATMAMTVPAICRRLDCLPLAIELIAARIDLFSPQTILTRLQQQGLDLLADGAQDIPERQRTLRQAIQYSYALLDEHERRLLQMLGVFVGGFELAAVVHFGFAIEVLQGLINKSLVQVAARPTAVHPNRGAEPRFFLLETVREYAREQLAASPQAEEAQQQHAAYYVQWVEAVAPYLRGSQATANVAQLEIEHNNIRAALTWTLATDHAETALRLSGSLAQFWIMHNHIWEGKLWLAKALALNPHPPGTAQAKARTAAGSIASILGENQAAQTFFEQSLDFYRTINDQQNVAWGLVNLGGIFFTQSAYAQAKVLFQQSLALYQTLQDKQGLDYLYTQLGWLAVIEGDYEQAKTHFVQAATLWREQGEPEVPTTILRGLASVASQQQDYQQANIYQTELLARSRALEDAFGIAHTLNHLGRIALYQGELAQATHYLTEGIAAAQALGYPTLLRFALDNQGSLAFAQDHYEAALDYYTQSLRIACQLPDKFYIATLFERLAGVVSAQQKAEQAAQLLGAAANFHETIGAPLRAIDQPRYQAIIRAVRTQLDETAYASAYAEGYAMLPDEAVVFALAQFDRPLHEQSFVRLEN